MFQAFSNFALIGDLKWSQKLFVKKEELCKFTTKIIIFKPFRIKKIKTLTRMRRAGRTYQEQSYVGFVLLK